MKRLDLVDFCRHHGLMIDRNSTCRTSAVLVDLATKEKIVITKAADGHFQFFSYSDPSHCGTVIDWVQRRFSVNLGKARQIIREFQATAPSSPPTVHLALEPSERDCGAVMAAYWDTEDLPSGQHGYLNNARQVDCGVLAGERLAGRVRSDRWGNAVFLHEVRGEISGFEMRGSDYKGYAAGGVKGLWRSNVFPGDETLVIAESAITAISYHALNPNRHARFYSTAGNISPLQRELITEAVTNLGPGVIIVAADHDQGGDRFDAAIRECFLAANVEASVLREHRPPVLGLDWNDMLRNQTQKPPANEPAPCDFP